MRIIRLYKQNIDAFSVLLGRSCTVFYYACIAISAVEVFRRYVLNRPSEWAFETVMVLCATAWILSAGFVTQQRRHIAITVLQMAVKKRTWKILEIVQMGISLCAISVLAIAMYEPVVDAVRIMERSGSAFNPASPTYIKSLLFVGSILYAMQILANIIGWFIDKNDKNTPNT